MRHGLHHENLTDSGQLDIGLHVLPGKKRAQRLECRGLETHVTWSNEPQFRLLNANGRLIIWRQAHEGLDSSCKMFAACTDPFNAIWYVELLGDLLHPLMLFCYPRGNGGFSAKQLCLSQVSRLGTGLLDETFSDFSAIN
ncbi:transposable element Tcb2 transposase [Trichonephila clavipes]|nr:transposable element Tcb2 transposase [Trichonephila clavipes]